MDQTDARRLTHAQLTELRKRAIAAIQRGESPNDVTRVLGVHVSTVYGWLARYRHGGWDALDARKRGGRPRKLTAKMMQFVYHTVTKDPRQLKFPFALWTSVMIKDVIWRKFKVRLSKASVCRLLNQLGLSAQKPLWRAYQQNPEKVQKWLDEEYPKIRAVARKQKAEIYFGDEAGIRSDSHAGTTWAKKGNTSVVSTTGARFGLNIISAVSPRGKMRFMVVHGRVTAKVFIQFLKRLLHNAPRRVYLIVDGHPTHKAKLVSKFVESTKGTLCIFLLPPYSPELNPDEQVWNDLKNNGVGRLAITGPDQLKSAVKSHLRRLQNKPERIRSFFQAPDTKYAAYS